MPDSLGRVAVPINPPGLVEGFAMAIVDKLASVAAADYLTKVTGDIVTHAANIHHVSLDYKWSDLTAAAGLVGASAKVANQGLSLVKTVTGSGTSTGGGTETAAPATEQD